MTEVKIPDPLETRPWCRDDYLKWFEAFLTRSGMAATFFGWSALGDPNFIRDLRGGQNISIRRLEDATTFARKHMVQMEAQSL